MATSNKARLFTMQDAPGLTRLNKEFYGIDRDTAFWQWKYYDLPGKHAIIVMGDPDNLGGQIGGIVLRLNYDGAEHDILQCQDILINKDQRQGRSFFVLESTARKVRKELGCPLDFGFSIDITRKIATHSLGFTDIGRVPKMVWPRHSLPYLSKKIPFKPLAKVASALYDKIKLGAPGKLDSFDDPTIRIERIDRFGAAFDRLWEDAKGSYKAMVRRDSAYLNWRYSDNPASHYDSFAAYGADGKLLGFISLEERKGILNFESLKLDVPDTYRGDIVDVLTTRGEQGVRALRKLIRHAYNEFAARDVDIVVCWCFPHMAVYQQLAQLGFRERPTPHTLIVRSDDDQIGLDSDFFKLDSWYLMRGDGDHY